jgi:hypothetical protein
VTRDPDAYAIWGDWTLEGFKVQLARWRDTTSPRPPADKVEIINQWWPRLKQPLDRTGAALALPEDNPDENLWWIWVPGADWDEDEPRTLFRVMCRFWLFERDTPPRIVCQRFFTVPVMTASDMDRADGMG